MSFLPYIYEKVTFYLEIASYCGLTISNMVIQAEALILPFREWQQMCTEGTLWT